MLENKKVKWKKPIISPYSGGVIYFEDGKPVFSRYIEEKGTIKSFVKGGFFSKDSFLIEKENGKFCKIPIDWVIANNDNLNQGD